MAEVYGEVTKLKDKIRDIISDGVDTVQEVVGYEKVNFEGFPAVTIVVDDQENSFETNVENERVYAFRVRVFYLMEHNPNLALPDISDNAKEKAERVMGDIVDQMINAFDRKFDLDGMAENGVEAAPSIWGYVESSLGWCRTADIILKVKTSYNVDTGLYG